MTGITLKGIHLAKVTRQEQYESEAGDRLSGSWMTVEAYFGLWKARLAGAAGEDELAGGSSTFDQLVGVGDLRRRYLCGVDGLDASLLSNPPKVSSGMKIFDSSRQAG